MEFNEIDDMAPAIDSRIQYKRGQPGQPSGTVSFKSVNPVSGVVISKSIDWGADKSEMQALIELNEFITQFSFRLP